MQLDMISCIQLTNNLLCIIMFLDIQVIQVINRTKILKTTVITLEKIKIIIVSVTVFWSFLLTCHIAVTDKAVYSWYADRDKT